MKIKKVFNKKKWASPKQTYAEAKNIAKNTLKPYKPKRGPYSGK
jgi:hypothetical protein